MAGRAKRARCACCSANSEVCAAATNGGAEARRPCVRVTG
ncbi:hypothetical protein C7S15_2799 [Burkholderia cepacia]|nr:hypothetical protein [Burkholderia cepacia]